MRILDRWIDPEVGECVVGDFADEGLFYDTIQHHHTPERSALTPPRRIADLAREREGKVLVDREGLRLGLEHYPAVSEQRQFGYCSWSGCCWCAVRAADSSVRTTKPHSGTCPLREPIP